ncbi:MAG: TraX family protein [Oscillospiraceae bacterium]
MDSILTRQEKKCGLSACAVKYIAVLAMLIDHAAWCFVSTYSPLGIIMHTIGRITAPVMTYFLAEGFHCTRNVNRYLLRLGIFAVISYFPYTYMDHGDFFYLPSTAENFIDAIPRQSVVYTLFLAVLALKAVHSDSLSSFEKCVIVTLLCAAACIGDWLFFPVVWALIFDSCRGSFNKQAAAFAVSSIIMMGWYLTNGKHAVGDLFQFGVLLALIPLYFYSGQRGRVLGEKADKWFFYIFYPLHMLILGIIKYN